MLEKKLQKTGTQPQLKINSIAKYVGATMNSVKVFCAYAFA